MQDGGTDWRTLRLLDVATGRPLADEIQWVKTSAGSWLRDGTGFFYSRFPEPAPGGAFQSTNEHSTIYFHKLGTPQAADRQVFATPNLPKRDHYGTVSDDGRWLVIGDWTGPGQRG